MMKRSMPKSPSHTLLAFCFWCIHLLCLVERCKAKDAANATTDPVEARALNAIFQRWGLSPPEDWNISGDPCTGTAVNLSEISDPGIKCHCPSNGGATCHVTRMRVMAWVRTAVILPKELLNLTFLTELEVPGNNIEGPLPSFIGNFRNLSYLDIRVNNFNGSLPPEIGNLPSLEHLDIRSAGFKGLLPPELGNLSRLQQLYISNNGFNGLLPRELGNLSSLQELDISYNGFNGLLPPELGNLLSLQELYMSSSGLGGEIPSTFAKLKNMKIWRASDSQLTKIPNFIGNWNLTELDVSNNSITGPLPAFIGNITSMLRLDVSQNYITGPLPASIGNLTNLSSLKQHVGGKGLAAPQISILPSACPVLK